MASLSRPKSFPRAGEFRSWLEDHGRDTRELLVRCYKSHAAGEGMTYPQAVDEALCFGWIDGVRRRIDEESFSVRFTPRKPGSVWSAVNIKRARTLRTQGRMHAAGMAAFRARKESHYSYETRPVTLPGPYLDKLQANRRAWKFFSAQPPWYRRTSVFWVMSAKRPETRERRLGLLIASSQVGKPIHLLDRTPKKA